MNVMKEKIKIITNNGRNRLNTELKKGVQIEQIESNLKVLQENSNAIFRKNIYNKKKKDLQELQELQEKYNEGVKKAFFGKKSYNTFHQSQINRIKKLRTELRTELGISNEETPLLGNKPINRKLSNNLINRELNGIYLNAESKLNYSNKIHGNSKFIESLRLNHNLGNTNKQKFLENLQRGAIYAKIAQIERKKTENSKSLNEEHRKSYINELESLNQQKMKKETEKSNIKSKVKLFGIQFSKRPEENTIKIQKINTKINELKEKINKYPKFNSTNYEIINKQISERLSKIQSYIDNPNINFANHHNNGIGEKNLKNNTKGRNTSSRQKFKNLLNKERAKKDEPISQFNGIKRIAKIGII